MSPKMLSTRSARVTHGAVVDETRHSAVERAGLVVEEAALQQLLQLAAVELGAQAGRSLRGHLKHTVCTPSRRLTFTFFDRLSTSLVLVNPQLCSYLLTKLVLECLELRVGQVDVVRARLRQLQLSDLCGHRLDFLLQLLHLNRLI